MKKHGTSNNIHISLAHQAKLWNIQLIAGYPTLLHLYKTDKNDALNTNMRYLKFLIFSSIRHFNANMVETCWWNSTHWGYIIYHWTCTQEDDIRTVGSNELLTKYGYPARLKKTSREFVKLWKPIPGTISQRHSRFWLLWIKQLWI